MRSAASLGVLFLCFTACSSSSQVTTIGTVASGSATGGTASGTATGGATPTGSSTGSTGGASSGASTGASAGASGGGGGAQAWLWVWYDYANSLTAVRQNVGSFTHISPALYEMNYSYTSGVPSFSSGDATDSFDGLTSTQIAQQIHAMGLKVVPLIFGGAANSGTDQGIQNVLDDSPAGTQQAFITALIGEAQAKGYDGWNLDWEANLQDSPYGPLLISFLGTAHTAFAGAGLLLTIDILDSAVVESNCSGASGFIELDHIGPVVDGLMIEAYQSALGSSPTGCPASIADPLSCDETVESDLALLCTYLSLDKAVIGLDAAPLGSGTNPIAGSAFAAIESYGFRKVAVWPDYNMDGSSQSYLLLDPAGISPANATWYSLLASFLAFK